MDTELTIIKASGERCPFSPDKLLRSLHRAGADHEQARSILDEVSSRLYEGITTKAIYRIAFSMLKEGSRHLAARYHLKQAIMELGPSGFPFERYVGELLKFKGYNIRIGKILQGKCVTHEIDVIADKDNEHLLIECKYHNYAGVSCDVKVPLYIHSRYLDVTAGVEQQRHSSKINQGWVVTNTRFTDDALTYAACAGLVAVGWDYPAKNGLKDQIDRSGLYPITCLTSLTGAEKQKLLEREIVLCKDLEDNEKLLKAIGIKSSRNIVVLQEVRELCKYIERGTTTR
ncbi:MAG: restriction endonuclease [Bacteroidota bacterium]